MNESRISYIRNYFELPDSNLPIESEKAFLDRLFYESQHRRQNELLDYREEDYKSDAKLFGISRDQTATPLYEMVNLRPKNNIELPEGKKFAIALTHDVDLVNPSFRYRVAAASRTLGKGRFAHAAAIFSGRSNPYLTLKKIVMIEKTHDAKSTFFFLTSERDAYSDCYDLEHLRNDLDLILDNDFEVGLHGGFYAYRNPSTLRQEKKKLEGFINRTVKGYRNHCLRFHLPNTWRILAESGFEYDSTFGFNDNLGFRSGLCFPFRPYDIEREETINIVELPPNVTDTTIFGHLREQPRIALDVCVRMIDTAERYGGVLTLNWHTHVFDGICWKVYERLYEKILTLCQERGGLILNGRQVVELMTHPTSELAP